MKLKTIYLIFTVVCLMMCIPLIAMYFTEEVKWSPADFTMAGILMFAASMAIYFIFVTVTSKPYRIVLAPAVTGLLVIIWLELAAGIFGSPFAVN